MEIIKVVDGEMQYNNVNFLNYINKYLQFIDVSRDTEKTYFRALKQFYNYINDKGIDKPTREDIIAYKDELKANNRPNTINLYLVALKNFYRWLEYENIMKDITKNIKLLKVGSEHLREAFTIEEINKILSCCKDKRERLIISLSVSCGIRINEMVNIRLEDFKVKNGKKVLYLLGKDRDYKEDFVIIPENIYNLIIEYIKEYKIKDYLFVSTSNNNKNGKITTKTIRKISNSIFEKANLKDDMHNFHSLRHSFATISIQNGSEIREVSQALRHKNIATSMIYLHDLEKTENKCSNNVANLINF